MVLVWKCFTKMVYFVSVFYENLNKLSIINLAGCWPEDWILMNSNITWIHNFCLRFNFGHWIQHVKIIKSRLCRNSMLSYFICLPLFFTSSKNPNKKWISNFSLFLLLLLSLFRQCFFFPLEFTWNFLAFHFIISFRELPLTFPKSRKRDDKYNCLSWHIKIPTDQRSTTFGGENIDPYS